MLHQRSPRPAASLNSLNLGDPRGAIHYVHSTGGGPVRVNPQAMAGEFFSELTDHSSIEVKSGMMQLPASPRVGIRDSSYHARSRY